MRFKHLRSYSVFFALGFVLSLAILSQGTAKHVVNLGLNLETNDSSFNVEVKVRRADSNFWVTQQTHNLVVNIGLSRVIQLLYGNASDPTNATSAVSLSNDATPLASWTKLPNELTSNGLDRAVGTLGSTVYNAFTVTYTWTSSADSQVLQCSGLHYDPTDDSDNNLVAAATYSQITLDTDDQIQVVWTTSSTSG